MDPRIDLIEKKYQKRELPDFRPGDTVKVHVKVREAGKERIQVFEGVVIARKKGGLRETFTVRKVSGGIGVERIFPVYCPNVEKVEIVRHGRVRRAKLYYLRKLSGKSCAHQRTSQINDSNYTKEDVDCVLSLMLR